MAVFRIERTRDYTVMSNHHLRNANLSLKAKGLLSMMLSLPEDWNYTTRGLAAICKEGVDAIGGALRELENDKDIMDIAVENYAYIEVCVTGKHICEENKRLRKLKEDRVYMLNLVSATQFYELTDMLKGKKCYREPCIYDWCEDNPIFDETMNDFLQDNLSELWEDCRPDRLKECIGRLYEKISSIRYFKGVKKKKSR